MSTTVVQTANMPPALVTGPVVQTSTASTADVAGAEIDATQCKTLSYTISIATNDVDWSVFGANASDYSDEVAIVSATKVSASSNSSYTVSPPPYRYYRVKIIDDSSGTHGVATVNGVAKG